MNLKHIRDNLSVLPSGAHPYEAETFVGAQSNVEVQQDEPGQPGNEVRHPVRIFSVGMVITRVWYDSNDHPQNAWRVDQRRMGLGEWGATVYQLLSTDDLGDALRGLRLARRWIRKRDRRIVWLRLLS